MKKIKYFLQFIFIFFLFSIFKLIGIKYSTIISGKIFKVIGPFFRSTKISLANLELAIPSSSESKKKEILKSMWGNYGKILAEYMFIKDFRISTELSNNITVKNQEIIENIKKDGKPVIFISGHFNNFELMAMHIEKSGIDLAAVYRPLNNIFLNPLMERIRKNFICKKQITKGISGTKELLLNFKKGTSIALMVDQRVSEGILCNFFGQKAFTTSIPAQFAKKFNAKIIPIYIERYEGNKFIIEIQEAIENHDDQSIESITSKLNQIIEKMVLRNPDQWIWTHNRWK